MNENRAKMIKKVFEYSGMDDYNFRDTKKGLEDFYDLFDLFLQVINLEASFHILNNCIEDENFNINMVTNVEVSSNKYFNRFRSELYRVVGLGYPSELVEEKLNSLYRTSIKLDRKPVGLISLVKIVSNKLIENFKVYHRAINKLHIGNICKHLLMGTEIKNNNVTKSYVSVLNEYLITERYLSMMILSNSITELESLDLIFDSKHDNILIEESKAFIEDTKEVVGLAVAKVKEFISPDVEDGFDVGDNEIAIGLSLTEARLLIPQLQLLLRDDLEVKGQKVKVTGNSEVVVKSLIKALEENLK